MKWVNLFLEIINFRTKGWNYLSKYLQYNRISSIINFIGRHVWPDSTFYLLDLFIALEVTRTIIESGLECKAQYGKHNESENMETGGYSVSIVFEHCVFQHSAVLYTIHDKSILFYLGQDTGGVEFFPLFTKIICY